jgi:hypothetical protein
MENTYEITPVVTRPRFAMPSTAAFASTCTWRALTHNHKQVVALRGDVPGVPVWSPTH